MLRRLFSGSSERQSNESIGPSLLREGPVGSRQPSPRPDSLEYTYNPDGSRKTLKWTNGATVVGTWTYTYDAGGRLKSVLNPYSETTQWTYEGDNKLDWQQNANSTWNGFFYTGNGGRDWPTSMGSYNAIQGVYFAAYQMSYDNLAGGAGTVGNLTDVLEYNGSTVHYTYDFLDRLASETRTGTNPYAAVSYTYDLAGNRKTRGASTYSYNSADMLASGSGSLTATSDRDGNLLTLSGGGLSPSSRNWNVVN